MAVRTPRGRSSRPMKGTTMMPVVSRAATKLSPRLSMGHLPGPVHRDFAGLRTCGDGSLEGFALRFADQQRARPALLVKKPPVETGAVAGGIAQQYELFAHAVAPRPLFVRQMAAVLVAVHLRELLFGDTQVFERELARIGANGGIVFAGEYPDGNRPVAMRAAQFDPLARTRVEAAAVVDGELEVAVILGRPGDGNHIAGTGIAHADVAGIGRPGLRFPGPRIQQPQHQH